MLKIMTMNLNYYVEKHGPWSSRKKILVEEIGKESPDIIALQAVRSDPGVEGGLNQAGQIAELFPQYSHVFFQPVETAEDGSSEGCALLSTVALARLDVFPLSYLPGTDDPYHRVLLHARIDRPGSPLHLFNAHFSWVPLQAAQNVAEFSGFAQVFNGDKLLVGDLNNQPDSEALLNLQVGGWIDLWQKFCHDQPGYTFQTEENGLRIDYMLANESLAEKAESIRIIADETVSDPSGTGSPMRASDHSGLVAVFR